MSTLREFPAEDKPGMRILLGYPVGSRPSLCLLEDHIYAFPVRCMECDCLAWFAMKLARMSWEEINGMSFEDHDPSTVNTSIIDPMLCVDCLRESGLEYVLPDDPHPWLAYVNHATDQTRTGGQP
jgi:hypothetical protein